VGFNLGPGISYCGPAATVSDVGVGPGSSENPL